MQSETTWTKTPSATIMGKRMNSMRAPDFSYNRAAWTLLENEATESGIPEYLRTAVLLRRDSSASFNATIAIEAELWGFKIMRRNITDETSITVDPSKAPMGEPDGLAADNLGGLDLKSLMACEWPLSPSYADVNLPGGFVSTPETATESTKDKPAPSESWYVELWALDSSDGQIWKPRPASRTELTTSEFPNVKSEQITESLTTTHLDRYLSSTRVPSVCAETHMHLDKNSSKMCIKSSSPRRALQTRRRRPRLLQAHK